MPQVGPCVLPVHEGSPFGIDRREIVLPFLIPHVHDTLPCEQHPVAAVPGRHDAVEHIHPPGDSLQDIHRSPDSHQVPGLSLWQKGADKLQHLIHLLNRLPDSQAADRIPAMEIAAEAERMFDGPLPQFGINAPLDDGEHRLGITVQGLRRGESG